MTFTLKWLILACILTQMLNSFFPHFKQDFVIKHFANCLIVCPIHICASHVCYGLRTYISFPRVCTHILPLNLPLPKLYCIVMLLARVCSIISLNHSKITWKDVWRGICLSIGTGMQFPILKTINSLCQYCNLTLKNRRCIHNRRWSLSTGHFLQNQTASCHNYGSRWGERERERDREREY